MAVFRNNSATFWRIRRIFNNCVTVWFINMKDPWERDLKPGLTGQCNIVARDSTDYTFILKTSGKKIELFVQSHCQCSLLFVPPGAGIDGIVGDSPGSKVATLKCFVCMYWALFTLFWFYWEIDGIYFDIILRFAVSFLFLTRFQSGKSRCGSNHYGKSHCG